MNKKIQIRGYSDDIIEVSGHLSAEFTASEDPDGDIAGFLAFNDGTLIQYHYDGIWKFRTVSVGTANLQKVECLVDDDKGNYSDIITLSAIDIQWVAHCNDYVK